MCWIFVPTGATGPILTDVDVIHQPIAIQEAFPCRGEEAGVRKTGKHPQLCVAYS